MDVLTFETCRALNKEIKKASDIKLVSLYSISYVFLISFALCKEHTEALQAVDKFHVRDRGSPHSVTTKLYGDTDPKALP